ncbi:MAG: radical SAM protein [Thermoanaerobaculaceae bacterium]
MREVAYRDFSQGVHTRVAGKRVPLAASMELTRRCSLRCIHCYNNLTDSESAERGGELTAAEHLRIQDELAEIGCLWLHLTGGEVLARRDFLEIYRHAKQTGFLITLFSNGTLLTPAIADALAELRPFSIEITLYGATQETYERVTGVPGSYERCRRGIALLVDRGLPLKLKTMALTANVHELWDIKRYAEEVLGVPFAFDSLVNARLDCSQTPLAVRLQPEQVVALDLGDPRRLEELRALVERNLLLLDGRSDPCLYRCGAGVYSLAIDPWGRMGLCVLAWPGHCDLRRGSVREGWEGFLGEIRRTKATRPNKCRACRLVGMCGMCPAAAELECGDPETPVDFLCEVAHLRALAVGVEAPPHGECKYCPGGAAHATLLATLRRLGVPVPSAAAADRPAGAGQGVGADSLVSPAANNAVESKLPGGAVLGLGEQR